jgi:uncharacterized protein YbjT (DUF2867 family)
MNVKVLVVGANGKTGRHIVEALKRHGNPVAISGMSRRGTVRKDIEPIVGDLEVPDDRQRAVADMDVVIHYAPAFHPRESAMGTGMIDAAVAASVQRFVYVSVLHPEIGDLLNHQAKLAVEAYLINSGLQWTVLRPQHYMQNIDVLETLRVGNLAMPYPVETVLGHVDMMDLADAVAKVALEPGHVYATYDIAGDEHLSVTQICATITRVSGTTVNAGANSPASLVAAIQTHHPLGRYTVEGLHRLFSYYARCGIWGNANVLRWLLRRDPGRFEAYVRRMMQTP